MPNVFPRLPSSKTPQNKSETKVEGVDAPRSQYSDRIKIDPFTQRYWDKEWKGFQQVKRT